MKPQDIASPTSPAPRKGRRRIWWALAVLFIGLPLMAGAALWLLARLAEPEVKGVQRVQAEAGLKAEVQIQRDGQGIPTIRAESIEDAMFGLGVAHAQDRLWQMETHRRIGAGRLAEVFGEAALDNDRFLRALGVRRAAAAQWAQVSPQSRALLTAYAAGVNHVIERSRWLPPEFLILGIKPEPWDPIDTLAWSLMMAWDLGGNWTAEMQRLRLSASLDLSRINEVLPPYPGEEPMPTRDYATLYRSLGLVEGGTQARVAQAWSELPQQAPASGIEGIGSNNWVIAGKRSATGTPLLANDPHLGLSTPALWYFARLQAPGLEVAGASLPGVPLVVLGQNRRLAWGFTNTGPDVQDLYIEEIDANDPTRYRTPNGTAPFEVLEEVIRVKGKPDVNLRVRRTRHGPVISDAGTIKGVPLERHVLALRWTALDADIDSVAAGLGLAQADSVEAFVRASQRWVAPMQSMVVADTTGRIAMVAAGRVPMRREDNDLMGLAPAPGWESRYDWVGWVPLFETPREFDPERGWIATANHRIHDEDYPHHIGSNWALPYRQQRIEQMLESRARHRLEDLVAMQQDETSLAARRLLPWLQAARSTHAAAAAATAELATFDGTMRHDRAAPLIYWAWHRALVRHLIATRVGEERFERSFGNRNFQDALEGILDRQDPWWCDDPKTTETETCAQRIDQAYTAALIELTARFGSDVSAWRWGQAHRLVAEHRPFSKVRLLEPFFTLSRPIGGDTYSVHAMAVDLNGPTTSRYRSVHGPSLKAVYDIQHPERSRFIHSSGQSGLPWQRAYRQWLEPWAQGQGVPVWAPADEAPAAVLRLTP